MCTERSLELVLEDKTSAISLNGKMNEVHIYGNINLNSLNDRWLQSGYSLISLAKMVPVTSEMLSYVSLQRMLQEVSLTL